VLEYTFLHHPLSQWLQAGIVFAAMFLGLWALRLLVVQRLARLAERTTTDVDDLLVDLVRRTHVLFLAIVSVAVASEALEEGLSNKFKLFVVLASFLQAIRWGNGLIAYGAKHYAARMSITDPSAQATMSALKFMIRLALFVILVILALDNLGVKITGLITGLGISGIAIALAVQNILGDLFAALSIMVDKPFIVGDFVVVGEEKGNVEHVGLKSTRLRSVSGEQIIVANADLLKSRVRNFRRLVERRVVFVLSVTYDTTADQIARIPGIVKECVTAQPHTRFDRSHFFRYGESSVDIESVYYFLSPDFNAHMDARQAIFIDIYRRFEQEGIQFAYPTRTLHMRSGDATPAVARRGKGG
jgi:small-conductance mechanosensitive channel